MTTSKGRAIADAIVSDCTGATWSQTITFVASYVPRQSLEDLSTPIVNVVYSGQRATPDSRSSWLHEYDIDLAVQKRETADTNAVLDLWTNLLDEIADYWKTRKPTGTSAVLKAMEWLNPFVPEHLTEHKLFTGVLRLTFRLVRSNS